MNVVVRLDEVCNIIMGQAPSGDAYNTNGDGWPLIAGAGDFRGSLPGPKKFTTAAPKLSKSGDIILGIRASIGDKVLSDGEYCLGRGVAALRPKLELDQRFLWQWLSHNSAALASKGKGATFKQVNCQDIGEMPICLPPLPLQWRIALILDSVDALRAKRRKAISLLDSLAQSIFLDMFGDPQENQHSWPTTTLFRVADPGDRINYGVVRPGDEYDGGIALVRVGNLVDGRVDRSAIKSIDPSIEARYSRSRLKGNEILVGCVGSIGSVALAGKADIGSNIARAVARIPISSEVQRAYVAEHLRSASVQHYFTSEIRTVAQPTLNIKQLSETIIMIPPDDLQAEFMSRVASVDALRNGHLLHLANLDTLFVSLQYRAFRGELWDAQAA